MTHAYVKIERARISILNYHTCYVNYHVNSLDATICPTIASTNKVKGSSLVVTIPYPLTQVLELSKGDNIVLELAQVKNEKVIVLRKMQKQELGDSEYKVNVVT